MVIGGAVLTILLGLMLNVRSASNSQALTTTVQTNLVAVTDIVETDFRKAGYAVPVYPVDSGIVYATPDSISFRGDIDNNGTVDNVQYFLGKTMPAGNVNPASRYLYRAVNGSAKPMNVGITQLQFFYYDTLGNQLSASPHVANPSKINSIRISLQVSSPYPSEITKYDTTYAYASWEEIIKPRNLRMR